MEHEFGAPDWVSMYPINAKGVPANMFSPRMACKLFHDCVFIIKKTEENQRYIIEKLPEIAHRFYKKKQWRKQFYEAMRRVCCRLARGLAFRNNCLAEDAFVHIVLSMTFELGWRRINEFIEPLPEHDSDRDFARIMRISTNEDIAALMRGTDPTKESSEPSKDKKTSKVATNKADVRDIRGWFKMFDAGSEHMYDHIVKIADDEIEGSSMASSVDLEGRGRSGTMESEGEVHHANVHAHDIAPTLPAVPEAAEGEAAMETGAEA
jgi:hypothetical protein